MAGTSKWLLRAWAIGGLGLSWLALFGNPLGTYPEAAFRSGVSAGAGDNGRVYAVTVSRIELGEFLWELSTNGKGETVRSITPANCLCLSYIVVADRPE